MERCYLGFEFRNSTRTFLKLSALSSCFIELMTIVFSLRLTISNCCLLLAEFPSGRGDLPRESSYFDLTFTPSFISRCVDMGSQERPYCDCTKRHTNYDSHDQRTQF